MQNQQLTYQYERGYERLTDRDNGEDLTPTHDTVARLKEEYLPVKIRPRNR